MPYAVTHVLIALVITELIRDYLVKDKKKFPLCYVLIAGIAGLFPDIDIILYILISMFGGIMPGNLINSLTISSIHPSFTHSLLWIPIVLILSFSLKLLGDRKKIKRKDRKAKKHYLTISGILSMIALGWMIHLTVDFFMAGYIRLLFFSPAFGLELIPFNHFGEALTQGIDAAILVLWLIHEEFKHKLSRFL